MEKLYIENKETLQHHFFFDNKHKRLINNVFWSKNETGYKFKHMWKKPRAFPKTGSCILDKKKSNSEEI